LGGPGFFRIGGNSFSFKSSSALDFALSLVEEEEEPFHHREFGFGVCTSFFFLMAHLFMFLAPDR
jgi:hypothetical protein